MDRLGDINNMRAAGTLQIQCHCIESVNTSDTEPGGGAQFQIGHLIKSYREFAGPALADNNRRQAAQVQFGLIDHQIASALSIHPSKDMIAQGGTDLLHHISVLNSIRIKPVRVQRNQKFPLTPAGHLNEVNAG